MKTLRGRNVCDLLPLGLDHLVHEGQRGDSRAGPVVVAPTPVMSVYERPCERVLLSPIRDANPFFHFFEALWMLAGRDDSESLSYYVHDFGQRYADDGVIHGAYGRRWRSALGFDQLDAVVDRLRDDPNDRQCVMQMWDAVHTEQSEGHNDLLGAWKDRPCNTHVYLRVRDSNDDPRFGAQPVLVLDLTVCCRSNDIVWGAYGANAVHFSFLQEYLAGRMGVGVGRMYQLSNNFHGYVSVLDELGDPRLLLEESDLYAEGVVRPMPIGEDWRAWDADLDSFMTWHELMWQKGLPPRISFYANSWFQDVAMWVVLANWHRKNGDWAAAMSAANQIAAEDWRAACADWLARRKK